MGIRLLGGMFVLLSAILFPWWVSVLLGLAALFYFKSFYEIFIVGLIFDSLYGSHTFFPYLPYFATILAFIFFFLIRKIRTRLIMY